MKEVTVAAARPWIALALVAAIGVFASPDATAQWKWRDSTGRVTVSDVPPPRDIADKDILQRPIAAVARRTQAAPAPQGASGAMAAPQAASGAMAAPPNPLEAEVEARKRKAEEEQKAKQKAADESNAAVRAENCTRAKGHLRALEEGLRLARTNEKGEREILDDKGRAAEIQRSRQVIAADCGARS